jgi:hypothetical protein
MDRTTMVELLDRIEVWRRGGVMASALTAARRARAAHAQSNFYPLKCGRVTSGRSSTASA